MARPLRVDLAGAWFHVMNRGIAEKPWTSMRRISGGFWARSGVAGALWWRAYVQRRPIPGGWKQA
jgi:hypothetical protein